jgi:outer membrane cobalamin receptor
MERIKQSHCLLFIFLFFSSAITAQEQDSLRSYSIETIEVRAKNITPSTFISSSPVQIVTSAHIERTGIQSVSDAVRRFSGVTVKDYGGAGGMKTVSIRGMGAHHTAVSYDGVPIGNVQSGQVDIGRFSLDNLSLITLTIGQSDAIFQPARTFASAGVLSLQTTEPQFLNTNYKANIQLKSGSFGLFFPTVYYAQKISNSTSISLSSSWQRADNQYVFLQQNVSTWEKKKRINSDVTIFRNELNVYSNLGQYGKLTGKINYFDSERGLPPAVIQYNPYTTARMWDKDLFSQLYHKINWNEQWALQSFLKFSRTYYKHLPEEGKYAFEVTQFEYYGSVGAEYKFNPKLTFTLTEDFFINNLKSVVTTVHNPYRKSSLTAFSAQYKTNNLTVTASLLGTYVTETAESGITPDDRKKLSPSLGFSFSLPKMPNVRYRASYKNIFRVPTFNDLYYIQMGNTDLKPENIIQYNVGVSYLSRISDFCDYLSFSVDAYHNEIENKILPITTTGLSKMRNFGEVRASGIDFGLKTSFNLTEKIKIDFLGNYSYQEVLNMNKKSNSYKNQLPYTPKNSGSGSISLTNLYLNFSYSIIMSGKRYFLDQNIPDNEMPAYTDHSISINKIFTIKGNDLRIRADLLNLANKNYAIIKDYPMPGRSFVVSAQYKF